MPYGILSCLPLSVFIGTGCKNRFGTFTAEGQNKIYIKQLHIEKFIQTIVLNEANISTSTVKL